MQTNLSVKSGNKNKTPFRGHVGLAKARAPRCLNSDYNVAPCSVLVGLFNSSFLYS